MSKNFKEGLIEAIKVAGQMIIDNAEDIAGKTEFMSYLDISVNFDPENGSIPELNIYRTHLPTHEQLEHINKAFNTQPELEDRVQATDKIGTWYATFDPKFHTTTVQCSVCGQESTYVGDAQLVLKLNCADECPDCKAKMMNKYKENKDEI
jgi:hypothetical protein